MPGLDRYVKTRRPLFIVLTVLCCALIIGSGIVQAGHIHTASQAVQADCALCHVGQLVVQPAAPQTVTRTDRVLAALSTALQPLRRQCLFVFSLSNRPPPTGTVDSQDVPARKTRQISGGFLCAFPSAAFLLSF